jgi:hypothetical protein
MVFDQNVSYKSFSNWQRPSDFIIPKIRIPETGFPDLKIPDPEW